MLTDELVEVVDVRRVRSLETPLVVSDILISPSKAPCKQEGCFHLRLSGVRVSRLSEYETRITYGPVDVVESTEACGSQGLGQQDSCDRSPALLPSLHVWSSRSALLLLGEDILARILAFRSILRMYRQVLREAMSVGQYV